MDEQMALEIILDAKARITELEKAGVTIKELSKQCEMAKKTFAEFASQMIQKSKEIVTKGFERIKQSAIDLANSINKTFKAIDQGFTRIIAVTSLIGGMLIGLASDANEMNNKFNVVFGELGQEVDKWADEYGKAINRSKNTIKGMLTENQDLFVGMGMTRDKAKEFSKSVVMLTNDLASFNNLDTKRASELMMSSLMGESQAARSLGANILETQLNVTALQMGYKKYSDKMDETTKMTIRYNTILRQNQDAMGDSVRTAWEWANVSRGLVDNTKELGAVIMGYLLPELANTAGGWLEIVNNVKDYVVNNKEAVLALLNVSLGFIELIGTIWLVIKMFTLLTSPIFLGVAALGILYVAWQTNFYGIRDIMQEIIDFVEKHPFLSVMLGLTAMAIPKLIIEWGFSLVGKAFGALLAAELTGAGLAAGSTALTTAGATAGASLAAPIIATAMIGIGLWLMAGGTEKVEKYLESIKTTILQNINNWEKDKAFINIFDAIFPDGKNYIKKLTEAWEKDINALDGKLKKIGNAILKYTVIGDVGKAFGLMYTGGYAGFETGGYTGEGGKYEIAGVVHKGEYVIPKQLVDKNKDVIANLESQRLRGFYPGGINKNITTIGQNITKEEDATTLIDRVADKIISIISAGGQDRKGVAEMTKAIEGFSGIVNSFSASLNSVGSSILASADTAKANLDKFQANAMNPENDKVINEIREKQKYKFGEEEKKFLEEMQGLGIKKPDLKYFEEYEKFLESSLKKMIDDELPTGDVADKIKDNKSSLETAKKAKENEENLKKQAEEFKNLMQKALETAISNSLETGNLTDFKTSLGDTAYETLRSNMTKAFSESKVYQDMFAKWFNTDDIKFTGNLEEDFKLIQSKMSEAKEKLNASGLTVGTKKTEEDLKAEKEKFKSQLNEFSGALSTVANQLNNEFLNALSTGVSGVISFMNALATFQLGGALNSMTGALGMAGAVIGIVQGITSTLDSKRDEKNNAQLQVYEDNTKALEDLGTKMDSMTSQFADVMDSIIQKLSSNPTLARTAQSSSTLSNMLNIIDENKSFGKISFVADYKKSRFMRSDAHRKETFTFGENIDNYSYEQLKAYREQLNKVNNNTFSAIANGKDIAWDSSDWGDFLLGGMFGGGLGGALGGALGGMFGSGDYEFNGIDSSNLETYKANIDNYLKAYEKIMEEQKEIMKTSTLESFEGIEKLADDDLREQYEKMFEDMGLDPAKYKNDIEQMVKANNILITATDDVRSAWIKAIAEGKNSGEAVLTSLSSYFSKMINNIASVLYDVDMSNFDSIATDYFGKFSEVLVNAKINGQDVLTVMENYLKGSDTSSFINEILSVKDATKNIEEISKTLREELLKAGLTDEDIDNLGIIDSTRQKFLDIIEDVKSALKTAISEGLDSGSLVDFKKSLGNSIYSSAKDALITAFSESAVYKEMFAKWFETSDVNFTGNLDTDFATMEELLSQLRAKLRTNGMDSTADDGTSSSSSSSYYTGTSTSTSSSGTSVVEYHYHFDFTNANVYNEDKLKELIIETTTTTKKV